ncbi:MAG: hypothetical protein ABW168_07235 [Sedimenticola sp.]
MEFITSAVLSGILYDMLKHGVVISAGSVKEKLKDWVVGDIIAPALSDELNKLNLNDELSESAIEKRIDQSSNILELISKIKKVENVTTIIQSHSGSGDNIGRDKVSK